MTTAAGFVVVFQRFERRNSVGILQRDCGPRHFMKGEVARIEVILADEAYAKGRAFLGGIDTFLELAQELTGFADELRRAYYGAFNASVRE